MNITHVGDSKTRTQSLSSSDFAQALASCFQAEELTEVARETQWMKRQGKILPCEFVVGASFAQLSALELTLNAQAACFTEPVSREAVHQRYNPHTVEFFHVLFDRGLSKMLLRSPQPSLTKELAAHFKAVHLVDSTSFDCPPSLAAVYPGAGGKASIANCKILLDYEYTRAQFHPLAILPGKRPDSALAPQLSSLLQPGELAAFDKGFWHPKTFREMDQKGAFFLTPWHRSSQLWLSDPKQPEGPAVRLEVADHLRHTAQNSVEWPEVWIGDPKLGGSKVRLVAFPLSEESANRHRQALQRDMQRKGRTASALSLELAGWLILVTNAPASLLPTSAMAYLYRVRWQVELVFKQCKSFLRIDQTKAKTNIYRIQSEIWARLLAALVLFGWHAHLQAAAARHSGREISFAKVARWLQQHGMSLARDLLRGGDALIQEVQRLGRHLLKTTMKGRQRARKTVWELLDKHWLAAT